MSSDELEALWRLRAPRQASYLPGHADGGGTARAGLQPPRDVLERAELEVRLLYEGNAIARRDDLHD